MSNTCLAAVPLLATFACAAALPANVHAQSDTDTREQSADERTAAASSAGMFLPLTEAPRTDTQRAFGTALGGYDGARDSGQLEGRAEVTVYGPIALRVGVMYSGSPENLRPTVGGRVQALNQEGQGIDMSAGVFYKPEGFTEGEGEIEGVLALGRRFGNFGLIADLIAAHGRAGVLAVARKEVRPRARTSRVTRMPGAACSQRTEAYSVLARVFMSRAFSGDRRLRHRGRGLAAVRQGG